MRIYPGSELKFSKNFEPSENLGVLTKKLF